MRITNNVLLNNLKRNLAGNLRSMDYYQNQLATGKRISKPSDDPVGLVDSLRLRTRLGECRQFQANVKNAMSWLETTDDTLGSLTSVLNRTYELTVYAANGALEEQEYKALQEEVSQLIEEVAAIANTTHGSRYIFSGTNTTEKTYAGGVWDNANTAAIEYEISTGVTIPVNITAEEVFLAKDMLGTLQTVYNHMQAQDTTSLSGTDLDALQANIDQVLSCRALVGARINRLEMTEKRLLEQEINFTKLQMGVEDIDVAETLLNLKNQESVYQASLAVGARIIMPTLMDFIR